MAVSSFTRELREARPLAADSETSLHLRTQFLRRVAHDIASPTGVSLTVLDELASSTQPRPELVAMARRSLRRLMRLSEHLALAAELEIGTLEPDREALDLRSLVRRAVDAATAIDGRKDVIVACDLPPTALVIAGDQRLLLVALREVIGNALKLASSRVEISVKAEDGDAIVRVDDDGPGFSDDARETLGRRFIARASLHGLGLSLSMAMDVLAEHDGALTIEPSVLPPGRRGTTGAAVVITLPEHAGV